jgi:hypothetical protein
MYMRRVLATALWVLLLGPLPAHAGYLIVDQNGEQVLLSTGRLKMAPKSAGGLVMVLDVGRGRLWVADPGRKRYWEGTVEEYCEGVRGLSAVPTADLERLMADQLKDMSPDEREKTLQMLKRAQGEARAGRVPKVTVQRTSVTEAVAGLPTRKYQVLADGTLYEELWLTSDPALLRELVVARAPETFGRMSGCLATAGGGSRVESTEEYRRIYAEGWPLKAVFYGAGGATPGTPVTRVERREVAEGEFTRPAGFATVPLLEVFEGAPR